MASSCLNSKQNKPSIFLEVCLEVAACLSMFSYFYCRLLKQMRKLKRLMRSFPSLLEHIIITILHQASEYKLLSPNGNYD